MLALDDLMMMTQSLRFILCLIIWAPYMTFMLTHPFSRSPIFMRLNEESVFSCFATWFYRIIRIGVYFDCLTNFPTKALFSRWQFQLSRCKVNFGVGGLFGHLELLEAKLSYWNVVQRSRRALSGSPTHSMKSVENLTTRSQAQLWTVVQEFGN